MLEKVVEAALVGRIKRLAGIAYKFVSPARRNVPDRIVLLPVPPEHQELVARYIHFVELKAPGKSPTAGQQREHARLWALGFAVRVFDNPAAIEAAYPAKENFNE